MKLFWRAFCWGYNCICDCAEESKRRIFWHQSLPCHFHTGNAIAFWKQQNNSQCMHPDRIVFCFAYSQIELQNALDQQGMLNDASICEYLFKIMNISLPSLFKHHSIKFLLCSLQLVIWNKVLYSFGIIWHERSAVGGENRILSKKYIESWVLPGADEYMWDNRAQKALLGQTFLKVS